MTVDGGLESCKGKKDFSRRITFLNYNYQINASSLFKRTITSLFVFNLYKFKSRIIKCFTPNVNYCEIVLIGNY